MCKFCLFLLSLLFAAREIAAADFDQAYAQAQTLASRTDGKVFRDVVAPHWLPDNRHFWYRVATAPDKYEFVLVDARTGEIKRAASAEELGLPKATQLSTSGQKSLEPKRSNHTGEETSVLFHNSTAGSVDIFWVNEGGERRPYATLPPGGHHEQPTYAGHVWLVAGTNGAPWGFFEAAPEKLEVEIDGPPQPAAPARPSRRRHDPRNQSPDGKFSVRFEDGNAVLVPANGKKSVLTSNGSPGKPVRGPVLWSPDSKHCVVFSVTEVPRHLVNLVESSPADQLQPKLITYDYFKPGDALPQVRPILVNVPDKTATEIDTNLFANNFTPDGEVSNPRWSPRGDEFYFDYNQRGHELYRILAINAANGAVRTVVEERSETFVDYETKTWREWLDDSGELLWMSERDGWAHLWLYDIARGAAKNLVTPGNWVVREVVKVDAQKRQVWFMASGVRPGEDPYHHQLCRVNFDGTGFVQLTQGDGDYTAEFSPLDDYLIAKYSRVDLPTVTELLRSEDGKLIGELERGDDSRLLDSGWSVPEHFVAKGRDGQTDIYGVIIKPAHFDPKKKYPVVEEVYAGPQDSFAPVKFGRYVRQHEMADLGFIIVQADGMGTDNRGKKFHEVCWKNLQDAGFPDRIAWIKAAARTRPWMDLARVGVYGGSAGGQDALRALLDHHDFYRVAVADCGCHDNRMDKLWWNEQWLGWPVDDSYIRASNVADAPKLQGKLLLMVGELDHNVDPASTMQVVNALEKANKDFEMLVITGSDHGSAETPYGSRRRAQFLVRNLLGGGLEDN